MKLVKITATACAVLLGWGTFQTVSAEGGSAQDRAQRSGGSSVMNDDRQQQGMSNGSGGYAAGSTARSGATDSDITSGRSPEARGQLGDAPSGSVGSTMGSRGTTSTPGASALGTQSTDDINTKPNQGTAGAGGLRGSGARGPQGSTGGGMGSGSGS